MRSTTGASGREKNKMRQKVKESENKKQINESKRRRKSDGRRMKEVTELQKWAAATEILIHSTERALAFKVLWSFSKSEMS